MAFNAGTTALVVHEAAETIFIFRTDCVVIDAEDNILDIAFTWRS